VENVLDVVSKVVKSFQAISVACLVRCPWHRPTLRRSNSAVIQTQSKSGTTEDHGGIFWYHFNRAFNAGQFGADQKGKNIENNFGGFLGGRVPGLNRANKTFFIISTSGSGFVPRVRSCAGAFNLRVTDSDPSKCCSSPALRSQP
jgi:hypothetical protein